MTARDLESLRKYTIHISKSEAIEQLNEELRALLANVVMDFPKRKKLLLQLERKHNQSRRIIDREDVAMQQLFTRNTELIRRIKRQIIDEAREQQQRQRAQQVEDDSWSPARLTFVVVGTLVAVLCVASSIIMLLGNDKQKRVR